SRMAAAAASLAIVSLIALPPRGSAEIPVVEQALGDVARGVGNVFGQGLAGLAGPTINTAENAADNVITRALALADGVLKERIGQVDTMLQARIVQIDAVINKNLNDLNHDVEKSIRELDIILDEKLGMVDITATKWIQNLQDAFIVGTRYLAIVI